MSHDSCNTPGGFDALQHAHAMAHTLGLTIDAAWQQSVAANLVMLEQAARLLSGFEMPDGNESALIFQPVQKQP